MFTPGETVAHSFIIPFNVSELNQNAAKIYITYKQQDDVFLERLVTSDWEVDTESTSRIEITLTQKESLLFRDIDTFYVQLNVYMRGTRMVSQLMKGTTSTQLKKEVIS